MYSQGQAQKKRIFILVLIKLVSDKFDRTLRSCGGKRISAMANSPHSAGS